MKIKADFITNSSSTSFLIISDNEFEKKLFYKWFGIDLKSDFTYIFDKLFEDIKNNSISIKDDIGTNESLEEYLSKYNLKYEVERVKNALIKEKNVMIGKLSSEENYIQTFFCMNSFSIDNEFVYINALNNGW